MKSHGSSVVAALSIAATLAVAGCGADSTGSNSGVFGPGTGTTGTTIGTGTLPSGQVVLVRLGTDNLIQSDPPNYKKIWVALVTDTNGNPVAGATVTFALRSGTALNPGGYLKGRYILPSPPPFLPQEWQQMPSAGCANEDADFNDILGPTEDFNGNGLLDPPGVSGVNATGVSDSFGFAQATIAYPQNYATWAQLTLEARTGASGVTPATAAFVLPGLASDFSTLTVSPPFVLSPFGQSGSCADTL